jgi:hypothetical protein
MKKAIRQFLDREEATEQIRLYSFPSDSMLNVIKKGIHWMPFIDL